MSRTRYVKKQMQYERMMYSGDPQAVRDFGVETTFEDYKDVHLGIKTQAGETAVPVGYYLVKDSLGDVEIVAPNDFDSRFETR